MQVAIGDRHRQYHLFWSDANHEVMGYQSHLIE